MQTWNKREEGLKKIPKPSMYKTPLIVRPLKLPRHTYKQVSLVLYAEEAKNLVYCYWWGKSKKRLYKVKRSFE